MNKKTLASTLFIIGGILIFVLASLPSMWSVSVPIFLLPGLTLLSIILIVFGALNFTKLSLWFKLLLSIIVTPVLFWILVAVAFLNDGRGSGSLRLPPIEAEKIENWKTYKGYDFEIKNPDENGVLLIAQVDGQREFLFGGVSCDNSKKESNVLGSIKFFPEIEGGFANPDYNKTYTKADCDQLVTRWIIHGRFCTDKNLTTYQPWCKEGSETSDYHRYDIYLACSWPGEEGRTKCNRIFNQTLSTFRFVN